VSTQNLHYQLVVFRVSYYPRDGGSGGGWETFLSVLSIWESRVEYLISA
jgi:hypothetical protein